MDDVVRKEYPIPEAKTDEPEVVGESEVLNFDTSKDVYTLDGKHNWTQRGYWGTCTSCPLEHGFWIGPDKLMTGISDDGLPILCLRKDLGHA